MLKKKAMTLMEIVVVVIIVGILSTLGIVSFQGAIRSAHEREVRASLVLVQQAEETHFLEMREYVACADTATCNTDLHLNLPANNWVYAVVNVDNDEGELAFTVQGAPIAGTDAANSGAHAYYINRGDAEPTACDGQDACDAGVPE